MLTPIQNIILNAVRKIYSSGSDLEKLDEYIAHLHEKLRGMSGCEIDYTFIVADMKYAESLRAALCEITAQHLQTVSAN